MNNKKVKRPVLKIPSSILFAVWLSQRLSISVAAKLGLYFFFRPQRFKTPQRELKMQSESIKESLLIPSIKSEVQVYKLIGEGSKTLLLHGWSGRGTQLYTFAETLQKEGMEVITFDMPAHGKSLGKKTNILELLACIKKLSETYGPFDYAIAHSMGSMALLKALSDGLELKSACIIGSGDKVSNVFHRFAQRVGFSNLVVERMIDIVEKKFGMNLESYSSSMSIKNLQQPLLIVHDEDDTETPVVYSKKLHQMAKNAELMITSGLGHYRILRDRETVNKIVQFIKNQK